MFPCVLLLGFPLFFFLSLTKSVFLPSMNKDSFCFLPACLCIATPNIQHHCSCLFTSTEVYLANTYRKQTGLKPHTHTQKKKRGSLTSKKDWNTHTDLKHNCLGSGHAMPLKITFVWFTCCLSCMLDPDKTSIWKVCEPSVTLQNRYTGTWCNQLTFYTLPVMKIVLTCLSTSACCCAKAGIKRAWSK